MLSLVRILDKNNAAIFKNDIIIIIIVQCTSIQYTVSNKQTHISFTNVNIWLPERKEQAKKGQQGQKNIKRLFFGSNH